MSEDSESDEREKKGEEEKAAVHPNVIKFDGARAALGEEPEDFDEEQVEQLSRTDQDSKNGSEES